MGKVKPFACKGRPVVAVGIANPLDPLSTRTRREFAPGCTVRQCVHDIWPLLPTGRELTIAIDGVHQEDAQAALERVLSAGQSVVFTARPMGGGRGGKNIFSTVSMIALMVAAPYAVAPLTPYFAAAGGGSIFGGSLAFTMQAVGGLFSLGAGALVSAFTGTGAQSSSASATSSVEAESPSWSDAPNPVDEGGCWPVIYGTAKMKPRALSWHKTYDGEKQYLHWLGAMADHAVDAIDEDLIEINGNPRSFYGDSITVEQRTGALDQEPISFFGETISEKSVNMQLSTSYATARTDGNACQGLAVVLCWVAGLGYVGDKGEFTPITAKLSLQRRKVGATEWTDIGAAEELVTAATGSRFYRVFRVDNVDENGAQFDVRVKFTEEPQTGSRHRSDCYLVGVQEIIYDDFAYPGRSLLGLKILADDLINTSTSLTIEAVVTRSTVPVWTGSAYENKPADNPAWAAWDFQHNADYGGATPASHIVLPDFEDWADWLATKPLYRVNLCMDSVSTHRSWLDQIAMLGRGSVVQLGTKYTCIVERPEPVPAQRFMFNVANIRRYSFKEKMLSMDDRATSVEVTYRDKDSGYSEQTVTLYAQNYDTSTEQAKASQVKLLGCDNTAQALAHAKSCLNRNRYLTNTVTMGADVDAIGVWPGQVIDVAHDLPQWGYSGLVLESTENVTEDEVTTATVTLDREVDLAPGTSYAVQVKLADDTRLEYPVQDVAEATTTDTLIIEGGWDEDGQPELDALYSFGPVGLVSKPFTVLSISRADDFTRTLSCLEYNENIFDDEVDVPEVVNPSQLAAVAGLGAVENLVIQDGAPISSVSLAWRGIALTWPVSYRKQGDAVWLPLGNAQVPEFQVYGLTSDTSYEFRVQGGSESRTVTLAYVGLPVPPDVTGFVAVASSDGLGTYKWSPMNFLLLQGYELRYAARRDDGALDWDSANILTSVTKGTLITNAALPPGNWTVGVKAVATGGRYSASAATSHISMGNSHALLAQEQQAPAWPGTITDMVRHHTGVLIPSSTALAGDLGWELFDTFVPSPVATCSYESPEIDLDSDVARARLWATADAVLGPGEVGSADPVFEVKYRAEGGEYGEWSAWSVGVVPARYVKFRVVMVPTTGAAFLRDFLPTVDVAPQTETLGPVSVPAGGGSVAFAQEFYTAPKVFPQVVDASEPLYPIPSSTTKTGCTMHVYDVTGTSVGGTIVAQVTT
jgi:hypothetical protein